MWRRLVYRFHPLLRMPCADGMDSMELGRWGERVAAAFLHRCGYKVLFRNFRGSHGGEVDLVCRHGKVLVFAEVKTRKSDRYGRPSDAVTPAKQHLIRRGAKEWLQKLSIEDVPSRFDVVEIMARPDAPPQCAIVTAAFGDA